MIIESLYIENFRQYKGPLRINFSLDKNKNFTVIKGTNGAGKTNLLNAITWCLYEEELHRVDDINSRDSIANNLAKNKLDNGDSGTVKVELVLLDRFDNRYTFSRSLQFDKVEKDKIRYDPFGSHFDIFYSYGKEDKPLEYPDIYVDKNLPEAIEGYFFFDGEKLEDYFDENSGRAIKDAVFELSQLNLFDGLNKSLENRKKDYVKELKEIDLDSAKSVAEKDEVESKIRDLKKELKKNRDEKDRADKELGRLREELKNIDHEDLKKLSSEKDDLSRKEKSLNKKLDAKNLEKKEYLVKMLPLVLSYSAMQRSLELGENLKVKGFIPAKYKTEFLEEILERKECICGNDLSKDIDGFNKIKDMKNKTPKISDISEKVSEELKDFKSIIEDIKKFESKRKSFNNDISEFNSSLSDIDKKLKDINRRFDLIDHDEIKRLNKLIDEYEHSKEKLLKDITNNERDLHDANSELDSIKKVNSKIKSDQKRFDKISGYRDFAENAMSVSEKIEAKLVESIRSEVEESTNSQFKDLMWKSNFTRVLIDKEYNVTVKDNTGEIHTSHLLSAGEKLVLALSFVSALNMISGFDLPFIIDTPMGRLDAEMKKNISKTLPSYVKGKQVTLLVTGEEYTEEFRSGIINSVGKEYVIEVSEQDAGVESRVVLNE